MQLIRWSNDDPFAGLTSLHSQLDEMFNSYLSSPAQSRNPHSAPAMDIYAEGDKQLIAEVNAPGFNKDNIEVSVNNGMLEIRGEKHEREEDKSKKRNYIMRESSSSFYRRIALPKYADGDNVSAHFEDGLLKVTVPFKELPAPKRVQIAEGKQSKK